MLSLLLYPYAAGLEHARSCFLSEELLFQNYNSDLKVTQSPLTLIKRQGQVDPKQYLDEEINYLIQTLPDSIDNARDRIQDSQFFKVISEYI